jgi:hypothetical protein
VSRVAAHLAAALLAVVLGAAGPTRAAEEGMREGVQHYDGARADYAFRCKGCHGFSGEGTPGHVPRLDGFVGLYTWLPEGRDYLLRVPGAARARLDDARLAAVLNWMLATYAAGQVAPGFAPFTAEEVGKARRRPLLNQKEVRARLIAELRGKGVLPEGEDGLGLSPEGRAQGG